jgi:hypothetical protein
MELSVVMGMDQVFFFVEEPLSIPIFIGYARFAKKVFLS